MATRTHGAARKGVRAGRTAKVPVRRAADHPASPAARKATRHTCGPDGVRHCPYCDTCFSRSDLIHSSALAPIGMMHFEGEAGCPGQTNFFFNHKPSRCGTTFATPASIFADEIHEPIPDQLLLGETVCQGHCARLDDLRACQQECANAPYRRFLIERLIPRH